MACLMQETRVALVSKHYALLGPVAEALLSFLFPFHWQGVYLPVMPYTMLEILEAPVPYLVGLHSRYLQEVPAHERPHGIVFVDLDHDVVHLGNHDEDNSQHQHRQPRGIPSLPERHALKLKAKLDTYAALVYVQPNSGKVASMTQGSDERPVPYSEKCTYAQVTAAEIPSTNSTVRRQDLLGHIDIAYRDSELLVPITGFLSEHGQFYEKESSSSLPLPPSLNSSNNSHHGRGFRKFFSRGLHRRLSSGQLESGDEDSTHVCNTAESLGSLLDLKDPPGFSAVEIRGAFLRFFVSVLSNYREYLSGDSFRATDFLSSLNISGPSLDFVHSMTKTQMFQRFLQERRDNPNDPEVLFFDASINAKRNRSKKTALVGRNARKETSFLDDTSRAFTDTYTPPAPSNWGLPYDGKAYHYGAFPELDPTLFGKIRPPLEWPREMTMPSIRSFARRASMAAIGHEQNFVSKALKPVIMSPVTLVSATKQGIKSLENALVSLSTPFANQLRRKSVADNTIGGAGGRGLGSKQTSMRWGASTAVSEVSATSDPTEIEPEAVAAAEEVVLNARRKAVILLGIFSTLQVHCRAHLEMKKSRHNSLMSGYQGDISSMSGLQSNEKGEHVDHCYESAMATRLQSLMRGFLARRLFLSMKKAAISIQARTRGRRIQFAFTLLIHSVSKVQTRCRGYLVRVRIEKFFEVRMRAYRNQIFNLWQRAYTPLSYRTKFWPLVKKSGFVRQGIAEAELIRLWKELGIPVQDRTGGNPMTFDVGNDKVVRQAKVMGMSHWVYAQCVLVDAMLSGTPSINTPSTTGNASKRNAGHITNATKESVIKGHNNSMLRLIAERKQVYERLAAIPSSSNEKLLITFNFFGISHKNKKKKHALAEALWQDVNLADESRLVMQQLFPELKQSSDICFVELPKKGVGRRFRAAEAAPEPLDSSLSAHTLLEERIRHHVAEVASICMLHVPQLTLRLSRSRGISEIGSQRQRRAAMSSRGLFAWEECRLEMMKSLIDNNCPRQIIKAGSMRAVLLRTELPTSSSVRVARRNSTQNLPLKSVRRLSAAVTMPDLLNGLFSRSSMSSTSQAVEEELAIVESVRRRSSISKEAIHFI